MKYFSECCFSWLTPHKTSSNSFKPSIQLPKFKWIDCPEKYDNEYDKCMKVQFTSSQEKDVILLNKVENDELVLEGHFEKESNVEVSMSINNENLDKNITVRPTMKIFSL